MEINRCLVSARAVYPERQVLQNARSARRKAPIQPIGGVVTPLGDRIRDLIFPVLVRFSQPVKGCHPSNHHLTLAIASKRLQNQGAL